MRKAAYLITIILFIAILAAITVFILSSFSLYSAPAEAPQTPPGSAEAFSASPSPTPIVPATPEAAVLPSAAPVQDSKPEYFVISLIGDCTLASSQHIKGNSAAFESVVGADYAFPFAKTLQYFENDYLSIANLESTFTTSQSSSGATFTFKSDPEYANVLSEGSIEAVVLGNNHALDYGQQGASDTKAALSAVNVCYASDNEGCVFSSGDGIKVGIYSKLYPSTGDVTKGVKALKDAGAEVIIAGLHWGLEGSYQVTAGQVAVGHAAIDAGADIVYGSHPHVLQKVEQYGNGYIFNSLGNWSFGGNTAPRDRDTAIIQVEIKRSADGALSISKVNYIPCELSSKDNVNNYQPQPYDKNSDGYARAMSKLDGSFTGPDLSIDYSAYHTDEAAGDAASSQAVASGEAAAPAEAPPAVSGAAAD